MKTNSISISSDERLSEEKRNELIADYQHIVDDAESGARNIERGMILFAKGRLAELRRAQ